MDAALLTDKGIVGILAFIILAQIGIIKVLWDAWRNAEKEQYNLGREVIQVLTNNEIIAETAKENFREVKQMLNEIKKNRNGVN